MTQYTVKEVVELEGVMQPVGTVVELADEVAAPLVAEGKLEVAPAAPAEPEVTPEATPEEATA